MFIFFQFNSFGTDNDETEEREFALEKACKLLMRINSGFSKVKQFNGKYDDSDGVTADRFLQYLIIDEMKENDHNIQVAESMSLSNSLYKQGYVGDAFVTHLIDQVRGLCYIIDCESMQKLKGLFNQQLHPLEHLPKPREQFAYLYEDSILFRAIRCDEFAPYTEGKFEIFLNDIGCKIKVDINKSKRHFFMLSGTVKSVSDYIRKCQIVNMPRDLNTLDLLHARIQYKIIFNDGETVYINVLAQNAQEFYGNQPDDQQNFYSYLWADSQQLLSSFDKYETRNASPEMVSEAIPLQASVKIVESIEINIAETQQTIPAMTSESIESNIPKTRETMPTTTSKSNPSRDKFAEITGKSVAEPAKNISKHNGTKVATGRKTRQEIATMLYNLKEEDKELPRQISDPQSKDVYQGTLGDSKQQLLNERMRGSHEKLMTILQLSKVPSVGQKMMVQATSILDVNRFYGYNIDDSLRYEHFFERFCCDSLRKIDSQLQVNDKILANFGDIVYRAVVTQIFDVNLFQVFYLDFGHYHKVTSANIFQWDPSMNELPKRALCFRINGIRPLFKNDICGIYGTQQILLKSLVEATVVDVCNDGGLTTIVIDATDENGLNVATTLTIKNFAVYD